MAREQSNQGFTLIELAVVVVIVGVLAVVGFASYSKYIEKSKIAEAYTVIGNMIRQQKTYFIDNQQFYTLGANPEALGILYITNDWDKVGYPVAAGSHLYFTYGAGAGKFNVSGTPIFAAGLLPSPFTLTALGTTLDYPGYSGCGYIATAGTFGVNESPGSSYDWVVFSAVANLSPPSGDCIYVLYTLESRPSYGFRATKGFIQFRQPSALSAK